MEIEPLLAPTIARGAAWSVQVRDVGTGGVLAAHDSDRLLRTASVGKLFLLVEVAHRIVDGSLSATELLRRDAVEPVADSGLWQHLTTAALPVSDLARLVGTVSDNWATNVLLQRVGLDAVRSRAAQLAPGGSMLHDLVRNDRGPEHPPTLSEGCASDWTRVIATLATGRGVDPAVSAMVLDWLATSTDLSMVASAFGLDPLAHVEPDRGITIWSKTGTDSTCRADVGLARTQDRAVAYAAICNWHPAGPDVRNAVLAAMRRLGGLLGP
jgi:beta-lactamase class A